MAKVHINGEVFDFDRDRRPLSEMIALEKALGVSYGQWEADMQAGSARALAGLIWLVWRRDGRDVKFSDIEDGTIEVDYPTFTVEDDAPPDPTTAPDSREASNTTGAGTSQRSRRSTSAPGRSASST